MPEIDYYINNKHIDPKKIMRGFIEAGKEPALNKIVGSGSEIFQAGDEVTIKQHPGGGFIVTNPKGQSVQISGEVDAFIGVHNPKDLK